MYLLRLGPDDVFQAGGEALADPFLRPVSGSDNQAEPGVGNLVANPRPAQRQVVPSRAGTPGAQHALGQENYMGAEEDKRHETR